jgi:outer membrane protein OmpA-like peptidoglycan-associated protein
VNHIRYLKSYVTTVSSWVITFVNELAINYNCFNLQFNKMIKSTKPFSTRKPERTQNKAVIFIHRPKTSSIRLIIGVLIILSGIIFLASCKSMNKTQKGAVVGTVAGGGMGAVIGRASGNTALGAIIGAAVGGATGAVIGHKMDKQAKEIENTVPGAKVERVGEGITVEFSSKILFDFDKALLSEEAKSNLSKLVIILKDYPDTDIEIQGHTDNTGSDSYNQKLSGKRATAVAQDLGRKGISTQRVTIKGFGEGAPKYENESEGGRANNRRVEFMITANEKMKADAKTETAK